VGGGVSWLKEADNMEGTDSDDGSTSGVPKAGRRHVPTGRPRGRPRKHPRLEDGATERVQITRKGGYIPTGRPRGRPRKHPHSFGLNVNFMGGHSHSREHQPGFGLHSPSSHSSVVDTLAGASDSDQGSDGAEEEIEKQGRGQGHGDDAAAATAADGDGCGKVEGKSGFQLDTAQLPLDTDSSGHDQQKQMPMLTHPNPLLSSPYSYPASPSTSTHQQQSSLKASASSKKGSYVPTGRPRGRPRKGALGDAVCISPSLQPRKHPRTESTADCSAPILPSASLLPSLCPVDTPVPVNIVSSANSVPMPSAATPEIETAQCPPSPRAPTPTYVYFPTPPPQPSPQQLSMQIGAQRQQNIPKARPGGKRRHVATGRPRGRPRKYVISSELMRPRPRKQAGNDLEFGLESPVRPGSSFRGTVALSTDGSDEICGGPLEEEVVVSVDEDGAADQLCGP